MWIPPLGLMEAQNDQIFIKTIDTVVNTVKGVYQAITDPKGTAEQIAEQQQSRSRNSFEQAGEGNFKPAGEQMGEQVGNVVVPAGTAGVVKGASSAVGKVAQGIATKIDGVTQAKVEAELAKKIKTDNNFYKDGAPIDLGNSRVITNSNEAVFWSGKTDKVGGMEVAQEIANKHKGATLEQLIERRQIQMPPYDPTKPETIKAWINISTELAKNTSGEVKVVLGSSVRPQSIWEAHEFPALKNNPAVSKIIAIDPKTGTQQVIFEKGKK